MDQLTSDVCNLPAGLPTEGRQVFVKYKEVFFIIAPANFTGSNHMAGANGWLSGKKK